MRTLVICTLAATLVGCSRQPPRQVAIPACTSPNPLACFMAVQLPIETVSFRSNSATTEGKSTIAWHRDKLTLAHARHAARVAGTMAKSPRTAGKAEPASRSSQTQVQGAGSVATAGSDATRAHILDALR